MSQEPIPISSDSESDDNSFETRFFMNNKSLIWIRFETGRPFKISITDCKDVADLIEAVKNKLNLSGRLDELYLFVIDNDGFNEMQRPGKPITQLLEENVPAGQNDEYPLYIQKVSHSSFEWSMLQNNTFRKLKSILQLGWNSFNWYTIVVLWFFYLDFMPFSLYSATFLFILLKIVAFIVLYSNLTLEQSHFTCSSENFSQGRYWTLVTSSLAHVDMNHLLCNVLVLALYGPIFESLVGFRGTLLYFCTASAVSSLVSLKLTGYSSIGSSGVIYAIEGFLIRMEEDFNWYRFFFNYFLFCLANCDKEIAHVAHVGGFLFGYLLRDFYPLHRSF